MKSLALITLLSGCVAVNTARHPHSGVRTQDFAHDMGLFAGGVALQMTADQQFDRQDLAGLSLSLGVFALDTLAVWWTGK